MSKIILFALLLLQLFCIHIYAGDIEVSVRMSYTSYWDYYGDGFFFHTFSIDTISPGALLDFNRIIRTDHIGNPQIWISFLKSRSLSMNLVARYQRLEYTFRDSLIQSIWHKWRRLDGKLNLLSIGLRLNYLKLPVHPYLGVDLGYGFGSLETGRSISYPPDTTLYYTIADSNGGGWFVNYNIGLTIPLNNSLGMFVEYDLRLSPQWEPFDVDWIEGNNEDITKPGVVDRNREFGRVQGIMIGAGLQYTFSFP